MEKDSESKEHLKAKGMKALIINIIFFVVLFLGIFLVTITGFAPTAIIVSIVFLASMVYIYFYLEKTPTKKKKSK